MQGHIIDKGSQFPARVLEVATSFCDLLFKISVDLTPEIFTLWDATPFLRATFALSGWGWGSFIIVVNFFFNPKQRRVIKGKTALVFISAKMRRPMSNVTHQECGMHSVQV